MKQVYNYMYRNMISTETKEKKKIKLKRFRHTVIYYIEGNF